MNEFNPDPAVPPRVLATDLDGTFIPLPDAPANRDALETFRAARRGGNPGLVFATGRHLESVLDAVAQHNLPLPDWIVCDVGTSICRRRGETFERFVPYDQALADRTHGADRAAVEDLLAGLDGLDLQPPKRQQRFKISYFTPAGQVERLAEEAGRRLPPARLPYAGLASIDSFNGTGLLDILPTGASKAAALIWLAAHADFSPDEVVFAGDSGNDFPALACGFRAIVVANASPGLAGQVRRELTARGLEHRLCLATLPATSGVLEGCRRFGLLPG